MVSDGSWWDCDTGTPTPEGSTSGFGDGSLGTAQFSTTGISQTGGSVDIDSVLSTGTKAGGPGASSYGGGLPSSNVYEFTVPNKDGQYDGDMTVVQLEGLTIDENVWLTTDQPGRGLLIYVEGDAVINGTLSMTARGAYTPNINNEVNPEGLQYPVAIAGEGLINTSGDFTGAGTEAENIISGINVNGEGKVFVIEREGAAGNARCEPNGHYTCDWPDPINGNPGQTGGGAGGNSEWDTVFSCTQYGGAGAAGTAFSGGAGGGSGTANWGACPNQTAGSGVTNGGQGGSGKCGGSSCELLCGSGGSGNPRGSNWVPNNCGNLWGDEGYGTGGLLWLVVGGDMTINAGGSIQAKGVSWGPGSGGGAIVVAHRGTLDNQGEISADGGDTHAGDGSVQIAQIDAI